MMLKMLKKYRKYALSVYFLLCIIYGIVKFLIPVETIMGEGLENLGKRQIVEQSSYLEEGDKLSFSLPVESKELTSIGFYLNTDELELDGTLCMKAFDQESGRLLAQNQILLNDILEDQFVQINIDHYTNGTVLAELTVENCTQGPRFWLNSTTDVAGKSWMNGETMENPLVYNAGFSVMTRNVKDAVVSTLMLLLFGVLLIVATDEKKRGRAYRTPQIWHKTGMFLKKHKLILGGILAVGIVGVLFFYVYDTQIRIVMNFTEREAIVTCKDPQILHFSEMKQSEHQNISYESETMTGLGVMLYAPEEGEKAGTLDVTVTNCSTGEILSESTLELSDAIDGEYINFLFTHEVKGSGEFEISLNPSEKLQETELGIYTDEAGEWLTQVHKYFNIFLKKYFFAMFAVTELFTMLFYWMVFIRKCKLETTVLVSVLFVGMIYNFLLLPYMAPDERTHIDMTYRYSNDLLGIDYTGNDIMITKRTDDTKLELSENPSLSNYYTVYHHLFEKVQEDSFVTVNATANTYAPFFVYFPAIIGMTFARLLNFGTIPMLMLSRWFNLAFFALCIWWCMKKLPFGKTALAVIALFPMTIQQCTSFSYDAVINGILFLFSAYVISMTYTEEALKLSDVLIVSVLSALLVYGKSGVYLPVCLAILLIPTKKFGSMMKKLASAGAVFGIGLLSYINRNSGTVTQVINTTAETSTVGTTIGNTADMGYTLGYFLQNPWKMIQILANTVADKTEFYVESLVGKKLGWVEIEISSVVIIGFLILFLISMLKVRGEKQYVTGGQKWWISIVCLLSVGMILMGMLLTWTPYGHVSIEGVQGRYFIPLLLLASLLGRNRTLLLNENREREIFCAGMVLELLAVIYLIKAVIIL